MGDLFYRLTCRTLGPLLWKGRLIGKGNIPNEGPAVFVANHCGTQGPVAVLSSFPLILHTWIISETVTLGQSPAYLRRDFLERELRLKPLFSHVLSWLLSVIVVPLLRSLNTVPVYRHSRRIVESFSRSLDLLCRGRFLLIFPEDPNTPLRNGVRTFLDGFADLGRLYREKTGRNLVFIPVAVNDSRRTVEAGKPVAWKTGLKNACAGRRRVSRELEDRIRNGLRN